MTDPHHHDLPVPMHSATDPELAVILHDIVGPDGAFRHRQHVNLAFLAVHRYGMPEAVNRVCAWIQQLAAYQQAPQKYHHTVSRAWVELVAHHISADPNCAEFDVFAQRHPALLDKRLLTRHYRAATLATDQARHGWTEPDVIAFPWAAGAEVASGDQRPRRPPLGGRNASNPSPRGSNGEAVCQKT